MFKQLIKKLDKKKQTLTGGKVFTQMQGKVYCSKKNPNDNRCFMPMADEVFANIEKYIPKQGKSKKSYDSRRVEPKRLMVIVDKYDINTLRNVRSKLIEEYKKLGGKEEELRITENFKLTKSELKKHLDKKLGINKKEKIEEKDDIKKPSKARLALEAALKKAGYDI